jgi:hypothetical protein
VASRRATAARTTARRFRSSGSRRFAARSARTRCPRRCSASVSPFPTHVPGCSSRHDRRACASTRDASTLIRGCACRIFAAALRSSAARTRRGRRTVRRTAARPVQDPRTRAAGPTRPAAAAATRASAPPAARPGRRARRRPSPEPPTAPSTMTAYSGRRFVPAACGQSLTARSRAAISSPHNRSSAAVGSSTPHRAHHRRHAFAHAKNSRASCGSGRASISSAGSGGAARTATSMRSCQLRFTVSRAGR